MNSLAQTGWARAFLQSEEGVEVSFYFRVDPLEGIRIGQRATPLIVVVNGTYLQPSDTLNLKLVNELRNDRGETEENALNLPLHYRKGTFYVVIDSLDLIINASHGVLINTSQKISLEVIRDDGERLFLIDPVNASTTFNLNLQYAWASQVD